LTDGFHFLQLSDLAFGGASLGGVIPQFVVRVLESDEAPWRVGNGKSAERDDENYACQQDHFARAFRATPRASSADRAERFPLSASREPRFESPRPGARSIWKAIAGKAHTIHWAAGRWIEDS
jgi:hypothetical protein